MFRNSRRDFVLARNELHARSSGYVPLTWLTSRRITGSLNDLEFHCGIGLSYDDDLRRVQLNLNEVPHANRDPSVPIEAVVNCSEKRPGVGVRIS